MTARKMLAASAWTFVAVMAVIVVTMFALVFTGTDADRVTIWLFAMFVAGGVAMVLALLSNHLGQKANEPTDRTSQEETP